MATEQIQWMATRELRDEAAPQDILSAQIGAPEQLGDNKWRCGLRIDGLDNSMVHYALGVDAFQALINAFEVIARLIRESKREFTWIGGDPGDSGFRRQVPTHLGSEFASNIESMIEKEVQSKTEQLASQVQSKLKSLGHISQ